MAQTKVTDAMRNVTQVDAAKITTGTIPDARIQASGVTQHVVATDLTSVRQDIAMLAIYNSVSDNRAAYNLPSSFIDTFQDDTGLTTQTDVNRNATGEYISSVTAADTSISVGSDISGSSGAAFSYADYNAVYNSGGASAVFNDNFSGAQVAWSVRASAGPTGTVLDLTGDVGEFGSWTSYYQGSAFNFGGLYCWSGHNNTNGAKGVKDIGVYTSTDTTDGANGTWTIQEPVVFTPSTTTLYTPTGGGPAHRGQRTSAISDNHFILSDINQNSGRNLAFADQIAFTQQSVKGVRVDIRTAWYSNTYPTEKPHFQQLEIYDDMGVSAAILSATGTLISDTQTASASTTSMSGCILYKDNAGTATLGSHLKIYLSANGGTNWTEVPSYGAVTPLFSTGVKMVRLPKTTVTAGTTPVMKAVWASQSAALETQLHGWAMNY